MDEIKLIEKYLRYTIIAVLLGLIGVVAWSVYVEGRDLIDLEESMQYAPGETPPRDEFRGRAEFQDQDEFEECLEAADTVREIDAC